MGPLDAAMITGEVLLHPINIGAVLILKPPRNAGSGFAEQLYRESLNGAPSIDYRLRRRPYRGLDTGGLWAWRDDDAVDLTRHLHRRTLLDRGDRAGLWRLIGELHGERLDRSRPLWAAYLIDGLADGRLAFYVKVHHVLVDGVAGLQMITDGLSGDPARRDLPPFYAARPGAAQQRDDRRGSALLAPLRWLPGAAGSAANLLQHIAEGQLRGAVASLRGRTSIPAVGAPVTPFNRRLGPKRSAIGGSWAKSRIRAIQQASDTRAHDVITAVVGAVLRSWLDEHDNLPGPSVVALCPITVRAQDAAGSDSGNRFGAWLCPIGTDLSDPVERLRRVHRSMREGKQHVARYGSGASLSLLAPSIASTIFQAVAPIGPRLRTGYNVPISSVPGPRSQMYWNGAHVEEIYPVSSVFDGQTLNVTACSYADRVGIGYVADGDVMPDVETLVPRTEHCLGELENALGLRTT